MGFFDFFKRKKKQTTFPENELEKTFLEAATDMEARERFYVKLLWNELFVITDGSNYVEEENQTLKEDTLVNLLTFDNGYIPVFTAPNRIFDNRKMKEEVPYLAMKGKDLFALTKGANLILNPYSEYQKELVAKEIEMLLDGTLLSDEPFNYAGENSGLDANQLKLFNTQYELAMTNIEGLIHADGFRRRGIGKKEVERLEIAITAFNECLDIYPNHWQSMLLLAKVHQRLRNHELSFALLEKAFHIELDDHTIPVEAAFEAMHIHKTEKALFYSAEAIKRKPDDPVLLGNHAMNLLIHEQDNEAIAIINNALALDPNDAVLKNIKALISNIHAGKQKRPTFEDTIK
ncbi:SseB family protein [Kordia jejudonensis]|uniref:SseB family protein n=1 Tax=Kordia jejudonensis TaxID=1348245 RepID=UPI00062944B7|nr:SseB family protein [Kordia jejudonensis]